MGAFIVVREFRRHTAEDQENSFEVQFPVFIQVVLEQKEYFGVVAVVVVSVGEQESE